MNLLDKLVDEFSSYYQADEIPAFDARWSSEILPEWADASAERLADGLGPEQHVKLVELLRAIASDPKHPAVSELSRVTTVAWRHPRSWPELVRILQTIAAHLERT